MASTVVSTKPQLLSGARGIISYTITDSTGAQTTVTLAIATDISVNRRDNLRPSYVIGSLGPVAIDPLAIDVDCSIGRLVPVNNAAGSADGYTNTTAIELNLESAINSILNAPDLDITITDSIADNANIKHNIVIVRNARFTGRTLSTSSGDVAQERLNFVGIYTDEDKQAGAQLGYETF